MKEKDLMIGDKVMVKVLSQIPNTYVLHTWAANDYSRDIQVKPIPLTAEILEKDGWERDIDKEWEYNNSHILPHYCYQWEKQNVKIEMYAGLEGFTISLIIGRRFYAVHELQHVLRLYGLDELADNFKVYEK